jgi:hypothetical protein
MSNRPCVLVTIALIHLAGGLLALPNLVSTASASLISLSVEPCQLLAPVCPTLLAVGCFKALDPH